MRLKVGAEDEDFTATIVRERRGTSLSGLIRELGFHRLGFRDRQRSCRHMFIYED